MATLRADGCPPTAIVAAFGLDERTVAAWQRRAGARCERVHEALVVPPRDLGPVPADAIRLKRQGGIVWLAVALAVPTRRWLGGVASAPRDGALADALIALVSRAAARAALRWSVDGWRPAVRAVTRAFRDPQPSGRRGRPRLVGWPGLALGQVVKPHARRHPIGIDRRVARGTEEALQALLQRTQGGGRLNTAGIERRNATLRARLCALVRRGRALARQLPTLHHAPLHHATSLTGTVYTFCAPPKRRGRPSRQLQALIARWVA